jgi:hypothetical protein
VAGRSGGAEDRRCGAGRSTTTCAPNFDELGHPGEAALVNLVPEHHGALGADGQGDHDGQEVDGKYGHGAASIFGSRLEVKGSVTTSFWLPADDGGVALVLDLHAELGEGAVDEVEVVGQGILHAHLAAGDGAEGEEGDDLVVVGVDGEHAALELRDAGDGELAGAEAGDLRAHAGEHGAEILHVRFAGGVEEDGLALGEGGGHDEVLGGGDGHVVRPVAGAAEAALERIEQGRRCG